MTDESPNKAKPVAVASGKKLPWWLKFGLLLLVLLVIGGGVAYWIWSSSVHEEYEAEIAALRARGEPVWFSELEPDPLPAEEDGTEFYLRAVDRVYELRNSGAASGAFYGTHTAGTGTGNHFSTRYTEADFRSFRATLAENESALQDYEETLRRGRIQFERDYGSPMPFLLEGRDSSGVFPLAQLLLAQGLLAIRDGDTEKAIASVHKLLALEQLNEHALFSLERYFPASAGLMVVELVNNLIATRDLTAAQRDSLDAMLAEALERPALREYLINERAALLTTLREPIHWSYSVSESLQNRDITKAIRIMNQAIDEIDTPGPAGAEAAARFKEAIKIELRHVLPLYEPYYVIFWRSETIFDQQMINARLALRVDGYYRRNGTLPEKLEDALDEAMPNIPVGRLSGLPVVYRKTPTGFAIYDVGPNGVDDRGNANEDSDEAETRIEVEYALETDDEPETMIARVVSFGGGQHDRVQTHLGRFIGEYRR